MSGFCLNNACSEQVVVAGEVSRKIKAHGGNMMMVEVIFQDGAIGAVHTHAHEQCTYVLEGSFEFSYGEDKQIVEPGDTIYFPPDVPHGCVCLSGSGRVLDVFTPQREDFLKA